MPKKIDAELKAKAVRLVREHWQDYPTTTAASLAMARQLGLAKETVRRWVVQADVDDGARPGISTKESAELKRLKAENRQLRKTPRYIVRQQLSSRR